MDIEKLKGQIIDFLKRTILNGEALRFAIVGVLATVLHYGIYFVLFRFLHMP